MDTDEERRAISADASRDAARSTLSPASRRLAELFRRAEEALLPARRSK